MKYDLDYDEMEITEVNLYTFALYTFQYFTNHNKNWILDSAKATLPDIWEWLDQVRAPVQEIRGNIPRNSDAHWNNRNQTIGRCLLYRRSFNARSEYGNSTKINRLLLAGGWMKRKMESTLRKSSRHERVPTLVIIC